MGKDEKVWLLFSNIIKYRHSSISMSSFLRKPACRRGMAGISLSSRLVAARMFELIWLPDWLSHACLGLPEFQIGCRTHVWANLAPRLVVARMFWLI